MKSSRLVGRRRGDSVSRSCVSRKLRLGSWTLASRALG